MLWYKGGMGGQRKVTGWVGLEGNVLSKCGSYTVIIGTVSPTGTQGVRAYCHIPFITSRNKKSWFQANHIYFGHWRYQIILFLL